MSITKVIELNVIQTIINNKLYTIEYRNSNNQRHNEFGPAYAEYWKNELKSFESYWLNNKRHNENGPAKIKYDESGNITDEEYYLNNKRHNENGPAVTCYDECGKIINEKHYLNDIYYSKAEWLKKIKTKNTCDGVIVEIKGVKYKLTSVD